MKGAVLAQVDNLYVTGERSFVETKSKKLKSTFNMSKSGPLNTYLSLKVQRDRSGVVYLSQLPYINQIIDTCLDSDAKASYVPCNRGLVNF